MSSSPILVRSNLSACARCRQRKKKCDQRLPTCRLCELAGVECVAYEAVTERHVPRSYIQTLEERIFELEAKVRGCRCQNQAIHQAEPAQVPTPTAGSSQFGDTTHSTELLRKPYPSSEVFAEARTSVDAFASLNHRGAAREPTLSQVLLAEVIRLRPPPQSQETSEISGNGSETQGSSAFVGQLDTSPASPPSREDAQNLVRAYFRLTNVGMPLLHEPSFQKQLNLIYSLPHTIDLASTHAATSTQMAVFFVFEVFAVAILCLQKQDPSAIPTWLADRYHRTAILAIRETGLLSNVQGVQALLLLAQYSYHHPALWSTWNTVGAALRFAVELRLHEDPSPGSMDALTLDIRRRTFWVAYAMDRNLSTALTLPMCLPDGAITAELPSTQCDEQITSAGIITDNNQPPSGSKCIARHIFRYRQIQSTLQSVLYQRLLVPDETLDFTQWQLQMRQRIDSWYGDTPFCETLNAFERSAIETFEVTYNTALLHLYRPSPNIPVPAEPQLAIMAEAAVKMIHLYRKFFRERKLTIYWQSMENLASAGIALMYGYAHSPSLQDSMTFRHFESLIHTCSSVLWGMAERFPSFRGKQDAFDIVASKTLADLGATSRSADASVISPHTETSATDGEHDTIMSSTRSNAFAVHSMASVAEDAMAHPSFPPLDVGGVADAGIETLDFQDMEVADIDWDSIVRGNVTFSAV